MERGMREGEGGGVTERVTKKKMMVRVGERGMAAWNGIAGVISRSCRGRIRIKLPIIRPENCSEIWVPRRCVYIYVCVLREQVSKAPVVSVLLLPPSLHLTSSSLAGKLQKAHLFSSLSLKPIVKLFETLLSSVAPAIKGGWETQREREREGGRDDEKDGEERRGEKKG